MATKHLTRNDLKGKVIDVHSHVGIALKEYCCGEYPYAQTADGIYYQQLAGGVDVNVVFPFMPDLFFEPTKLLRGEKVPAREPLSKSPYATDNLILMREVFDYCPDRSHRFLPFVSLDPGRCVAEQLAALERLDEQYPIYGIKIHPVGCQSHALEFLGKGEPFLDFAQERDIPFLFHATTVPNDEYSQASDILQIAQSRPALRFCLAHCLFFHYELLEQASRMPNVWVDTAALKIQVDVLLQLVGEGIVKASDLLDIDYSDYREVMVFLCTTYPDTILWGTDSPAFTYHCRRNQGDDMYQEFALKGRYEDEVAALNALPEELRRKASNTNTQDFLFGRVG